MDNLLGLAREKGSSDPPQGGVELEGRFAPTPPLTRSRLVVGWHVRVRRKQPGLAKGGVPGGSRLGQQGGLRGRGAPGGSRIGGRVVGSQRGACGPAGRVLGPARPDPLRAGARDSTPRVASWHAAISDLAGPCPSPLKTKGAGLAGGQLPHMLSPCPPACRGGRAGQARGTWAAWSLASWAYSVAVAVGGGSSVGPASRSKAARSCGLVNDSTISLTRF